MDQVNRTLLKPKDVKVYHPSLNEQRLARLRLEGGGPAFIKLGRSVFYDPADIDAWLDANRRHSTSDTAGNHGAYAPASTRSGATGITPSSPPAPSTPRRRGRPRKVPPQTGQTDENPAAPNT